MKKASIVTDYLSNSDNESNRDNVFKNIFCLKEFKMKGYDLSTWTLILLHHQT